MSSTKSKKSDSNSISNENDDEKTLEEVQMDPEGDRFGMFPECAYSGWNIFIGVFLLFTTIFLQPGDIASVVTQCFAVVYIFVGLLAFVIIFKSARSIFVVLTVFAGITIVLTSLTIIGFVYSIEGSVPVPELMLKNKFLEIVLGVLLFFHIVFNIFCFFVFLKRSCKSTAALEIDYSQRSHRATTPEKPEKGSAEIVVMDM